MRLNSCRWNSEVIEHGVTGLLAPSRNAALLAEHLRVLITNPDIRQQFAEAAKARAISRFSDIAMHESYQKMYLDLATK